MLVRRDNDKDFIVPCILVLLGKKQTKKQKKKLKGTPLNKKINFFADSSCDQLATRPIIKANLKDKTKTKQGKIEIKNVKKNEN